MPVPSPKLTSALQSFISCSEVNRFCERDSGAHSALCAFVLPPRSALLSFVSWCEVIRFCEPCAHSLRAPSRDPGAVGRARASAVSLRLARWRWPALYVLLLHRFPALIFRYSLFPRLVVWAVTALRSSVRWQVGSRLSAAPLRAHCPIGQWLQGGKPP